MHILVSNLWTYAGISTCVQVDYIMQQVRNRTNIFVWFFLWLDYSCQIDTMSFCLFSHYDTCQPSAQSRANLRYFKNTKPQSTSSRDHQALFSHENQSKRRGRHQFSISYLTRAYFSWTNRKYPCGTRRAPSKTYWCFPCRKNRCRDSSDAVLHDTMLRL